MPTQTIGSQHARELQEVADSICRSNQVLMVTGAGISTNSGIPDFRSANGLYNLVKRRYPEQTALLKGKDLFDAISFTNPITTAILYSFLAELRQTVKGIKESTPTHKFIKNLSDTGRLLRCYTQNIDGLEALDGLCMDISRGAGKRGKGKEKIGREAGCEVVQLHGDLEMLRCTQCAKLHNYNEERIEILLGGEGPECPDCSRKADDRLAAGKRSINVGTLRPNIVLYDEPHPQGDAIGQLTHYDATRMTPDLLLIFGTSLKVIGLKRIVKAFAAKVKDRGGKVVYINATAAADSIWGDIIDFHIQMDCDAWIKDLKLRRKEIWLHQSLLDKEWKKTKVPSLTKSKTMGYESDKENIERLGGHPLVRRKSLSSLPSKKKAGSAKEKQLPTPTNTPRKEKPKSAPNTPAHSTSKRGHNSAFPSTSPLTSLTATPSCSFTNTPRKRVRLLSTPLPPMNATTPPHHHRIQDLRTPQRPSPGAISWVSSSLSSSTGQHSTPTQRNYYNFKTPDRPIPDSPFLSDNGSDPVTPTRGKERFFLDHIAVPFAADALPSSPPRIHDHEESALENDLSTPRRPARSEISSLTNSVSSSAQRRGIRSDAVSLDGTPSPSPKSAHHLKIEVEEGTIHVRARQLPTPPDSQVPSDLASTEQELPSHGTEDDEDVKYRPRNRTSKRRVFPEEVERDFERLESDVTEVDVQLEREAGMARHILEDATNLEEESKYVAQVSDPMEEEDIDDVDLIPIGPIIDSTIPEPISYQESAPEKHLLPPVIEDNSTTPKGPVSTVETVITLTPFSKSKKKTASPATVAVMERRRTRGLEKDEAILKELSKPGTVTRREAQRRRSLKAEFKGVV